MFATAVVKADGLSFWVKGDGTDGFGGLEFIWDDDYSVRYDLCFPVKGKDWTKVTVAWLTFPSMSNKPRSLGFNIPTGDERLTTAGS